MRIKYLTGAILNRVRLAIFRADLRMYSILDSSGVILNDMSLAIISKTCYYWAIAEMDLTKLGEIITLGGISMKDSELITFENQDIGEIRGFLKDGEPWFLAGQVCRCLGIKDAGKAVLQTEERLKIAGVKGAISNRILFETSGGKQNIIIINEQCLYELIFASRKQKAIKFRSWVTGEVLPSLRRHGEYRMTGKLIRRVLTDSVQAVIIPKIESEMGKKFAYSNFTKMINKSLGLPEKANRDGLDDALLEKIAHRENLVAALIEEGKEYHEIKAYVDTLDPIAK
jgi:prophage antirepressor-like protein